MKQVFVITLPPDFYILCNIFSCTPQEVVQYYVNHISLSLFSDVSLDNPFGAATCFFAQYSDLEENDE